MTKTTYNYGPDSCKMMNIAGWRLKECTYGALEVANVKVCAFDAIKVINGGL